MKNEQLEENSPAPAPAPAPRKGFSNATTARNSEQNCAQAATQNCVNPLSFSYEFFPPRELNQQRRFWRTVGCLETLDPNFFSVTYGALGTHSEASLEIVGDLVKESAIPTAAHLTCLNKTPSEINHLLGRLQKLGVEHVVALRGDLNSAATNAQQGNSSTRTKVSDGSQEDTLRYAEELVQLVAAYGGFEISVAAYPEIHPEARDAEADLANLKRKFQAGATRALTQYFYDGDSFLWLRDEAAKSGIAGPIVPGILPIHDIDKVVAFSRRCGASVPKMVIERFSALKRDDPGFREFSIDQSVSLCERLMSEGIEDFHFYTLNQSDLTYEVSKILKGESLPIGKVAA